MDKEAVVFRGTIHKIAETEFGASVTHELAEALHDKWTSQGSPVDPGEWIRTEISQIFPVVDARPRWNGEPDWQYHEGKPMLFLGQLNLPLLKLPTGQVSLPMSVYVFAAAEPYPGISDGWTLQFSTIQQSTDE